MEKCVTNKPIENESKIGKQRINPKKTRKEKKKRQIIKQQKLPKLQTEAQIYPNYINKKQTTYSK